MNIQKVTEVQSFLQKNPGYFKWGNEKLAMKLGCTVEEAKCAKKYSNSKYRVGDNFIINNKEDFKKFVSVVNDRNIEGLKHDEESLKTFREINSSIMEFYLGSNITIDERFNTKIKDKEVEQFIPSVKILFIDIETAPIKAFVWRFWKQDISLPQLISDYFILTWSAKWLDSNSVISDRVTSAEAKNEDDKRIIKGMWRLFDEADIIVAHNGDRFDIPKLNTRFIVHGMVPPSPYKTVDTMLVAKKQFGFSSNKLQHLANNFGIEGKYDTDFELWKKCLEGDEESLEYMEEYNQHDVEILEKVYLKLRPYIKGHPNIDIYSNDKESHCTLCGSKNLIIEPGKNFYTQAVEYQVYRCQDCGGLTRAKQGNKMLHKKVVSAIPR